MIIKVGAHDIKVEFIDRPHMDVDANAIYGSEHNLMRIQDDLPLSQKVTGFMHELLHVINNEMEEKEIEFLAQALSQVLLNNGLLEPGFIKKLDLAEKEHE